MNNTLQNIETIPQYYQEQVLVNNIRDKYDYFDEQRNGQKSDNRLISYAIYNSTIPTVNSWNCKIQLPEIYELSQTLKSHLMQNLYSHPDGMFDVSGVDFQSQKFANRQKSMLVNTFEEMKISLEKQGKSKSEIINSIKAELNLLSVGMVPVQILKSPSKIKKMSKNKKFLYYTTKTLQNK